MLLSWNVRLFLCSPISSAPVSSVPDMFLVWALAVNEAGRVSPLTEPPHIQESQNQQRQRQCKGRCSKVVTSLEKQKSGEGFESGVGGEWLFYFR